MQLDLHAEAASVAGSSVPALTALNPHWRGRCHRVFRPISNPIRRPLRSASQRQPSTHPDATALLRQLGASVLPFNGLGRGHIEIKTQGLLGGAPGDHARRDPWPASTVKFQGRIEPPTGTSSFAANGRLTLAGSDLSAFLQATGFAFPDLTARLPADLASELDWRGARLDLRNSGALSPAWLWPAGSPTGRKTA